MGEPPRLHFPSDGTLGEEATRVAIGLMLLAVSGFVFATGHGSRRFMRLFLTGAVTMLAIGILAVSFARSEARPLSSKETMAARSGEIIGAASVCDVTSARLVAVGRQAIQDVRFGAEADAARRLQAIHEAAIYALASKVSRHPSMCGIVTARFAELERACVQDRLVDCTMTVRRLRLPPR